MAAPTIALRFRDSTPGIDTIASHREVLAAHGVVWWGWWKKVFEEANVQAIRSGVARGKETAILLVDRSTERAFQAKCIEFAARPGDIDLMLVPKYYREHVGEIAGFFLLTAIVELPYEQDVGDALGEQTFLWIGATADPRLGHIAATADAKGRSCVLHLSDLHFGADYGFRLQNQCLPIGDTRRTFTECLIADLDRVGCARDIAAVVVTGDFMSRGRWDGPVRAAALAEFEELRARLDLDKSQIIAVPGNHDVVRYSDNMEVDVVDLAVGKQTNYDHEREFRHFIYELLNRDQRASLNYIRRVQLSRADLILCAVNSCTIAATKWTEYGYIGRNGLDAIRDMSREVINRPTFRFLALHHHLLPVAAVEAPNSRGVTLALDASDILAEAQRSGVNVALHGHQHKPKIALYQNLSLDRDQSRPPIHVVANGSAGAKSECLPVGERNTYCLFSLTENAVELWIRELRPDAVEGAELFRGPLQTSPAVP